MGACQEARCPGFFAWQRGSGVLCYGLLMHEAGSSIDSRRRETSFRAANPMTKTAEDGSYLRPGVRGLAAKAVPGQRH